MARKSRLKKPAANFRPAPAVQTIGEQIISQFFPHLAEEGVRIDYIFRSDTPKRLGNAVWGTAQKVTSLKAFFGRRAGVEVVKPFFAIVISEGIWCDLDPPQRVALVHHELCHCGVRHDDEGNILLYLIPHDLEEFRAVIDVYGDWSRSAELMRQSFENAPRLQQEMQMEGAER